MSSFSRRPTAPGARSAPKLDAGHTVEWGPQGFLDNAPDTLELARAHRSRRGPGRGGRRLGRPLHPPRRSTARGADLARRLRHLRVSCRSAADCGSSASLSPDADPTATRPSSTSPAVGSADRRPRSWSTPWSPASSPATRRQLSLAATFPKMYAMESEHGSLTRALIAKMREARKQDRTSAGPTGPGGTLHTFAERHGAAPASDRRPARTIGSSWTPPSIGSAAKTATSELETDGGVIRADRVLLTLPAAGAARLLAELAPAAVERRSRPPRRSPSPWSWRRTPAMTPSVDPVDGFGFLVPKAENAGILGTLFCHSIFPGQAPDGTLFLRTMLGGAREPGQASPRRTTELHRAQCGRAPPDLRPRSRARLGCGSSAGPRASRSTPSATSIAWPRPRTPPAPSASSSLVHPIAASRSTTASGRRARRRNVLRARSSLIMYFEFLIFNSIAGTPQMGHG